jgi:hypothetical protein
MTVPKLCNGCGRKLSKVRLRDGKPDCYPCECKKRREQKQRGHDRRIESEDFTAADYRLLYETQGGRCAIKGCRATGKTKHLAVEHDHSCDRGHDPKKWCRACVRGLTCGMHNEWIGRTGDNPEIFDALAAYLRDPPARKLLMDNVITGTERDTLKTLHDEYEITWKLAKQLVDLARGVGPSPCHLGDVTIIIKYLRAPRSRHGLYEITESEPWLDSISALNVLMKLGLSDKMGKSILNAAWESGRRRKTTPSGDVRIVYRGRGAGEAYMFTIEKV